MDVCGGAAGGAGVLRGCADRVGEFSVGVAVGGRVGGRAAGVGGGGGAGVGAGDGGVGAGGWVLVVARAACQGFSGDVRIESVSFRLEWTSGDVLVDAPLVLAGETVPELGPATGALVRFVRRDFTGVTLALWHGEADA